MCTSVNSLEMRRLFVGSMILPMMLFIFPAFAEGDGESSSGHHTYTKICGHCHDIGIGPVIKGRQLPPEYVSHAVRHGFRAMPAFPEPYISDEELKQLGQYIQQSIYDKK